jgi:hypothetical protein
VPHVLSSNVDGHFDVKLELHHFEWCGVPVSKEISNKSPISS